MKFFFEICFTHSFHYEYHQIILFHRSKLISKWIFLIVTISNYISLYLSIIILFTFLSLSFSMFLHHLIFSFLDLSRLKLRPTNLIEIYIFNTFCEFFFSLGNQKFYAVFYFQVFTKLFREKEKAKRNFCINKNSRRCYQWNRNGGIYFENPSRETQIID